MDGEGWGRPWVRDVVVLGVVVCLLAGWISCSRPPDRPWKDGRDLVRRLEPYWKSYVDASPGEARRLAEQAVQLCREELRRPVVKDQFVYVFLFEWSARLYCVNLCGGDVARTEMSLALARCAYSEYMRCVTRTSRDPAQEYVKALRKFSPGRMAWYVLGLDMKGNGGKLPRYVRENCAAFRGILAAHGVECPGGEAGVSEAGTRGGKEEQREWKEAAPHLLSD